MSDETTLKGTIVLDADTSIAEAKIEALEKKGGQSRQNIVPNVTSHRAPENTNTLDHSPAAKPPKEHKAPAIKATFAQNFVTSLTEQLQGKTTSIVGKFGPVGQAIGKSIGGLKLGDKAAGMVGSVAGEGAEAGGAMAGIGVGGGMLLGGAVVGGALASVVAVGAALKSVTTRLLNFGRSLSVSSPALAATFAIFDLKMRLLWMQIGGKLQPAFEKLTNAVVKFVSDNMSSIVSAMNGLLGAVTKLIPAFGSLFTSITELVTWIFNHLPHTKTGAASATFGAIGGGW